MKFDSQDLKRKFDRLKHTLEQEEKTKRDMWVNLSDLFMSKDGLIRREVQKWSRWFKTKRLRYDPSFQPYRYPS